MYRPSGLDLLPGERIFRIDWSWGIADTEDSGGGSYWLAVSGAIPRGDEEMRLRDVIRAYYEKANSEESPTWGMAMMDNANLLKGSGFRLLTLPTPSKTILVDLNETLYEGVTQEK